MAREYTILAIALAFFMVPLALLAQPSRVLSAAEELAVIANPSVPGDRLGAAVLEAVFTLSDGVWSNGDRIVVLNHVPATPTRVAFDRAVLRMDPNHVARFWVDRRIRGQGTSPRAASSPQLLLKVVSKLRGSISYVPSSMVIPGAGVKVVARVRNGEVVGP